MATAPPALPPDTAPVRGYLLHVFHRLLEGRTVVYAIGRLENGETFGLADRRSLPGFYLRASDADAAARVLTSREGRPAACGLRTMDGEPVLRVNARTLTAGRRLAARLQEAGVRTYEADVNYGHHYLMERGVRRSVCLSGSWRPGRGVGRAYVDPHLEPCEWEPQLAVVALDIETEGEAGGVIAVSLVGAGTPGLEGLEEVHVVGEPAAGDGAGLRCHADERALLTALGARIRSLDPDVLTGWNLVDFDLVVLQRRCRELGLPFNLGRTVDDSWYREGEVWGASRMVVYGRQILDALHLVRASLPRFDDYRLDTVARAVLGRGKLLQAGEHESMPETILKAYAEDRAAFCEYCLEDARLVRDILRRERLLSLAVRRSLLTGLPLDRAWGSIAAFDFLYISELHRRGMVAPSVGVDRRFRGGSPGGMVFAAAAALYRHVLVFDFKSLYPSVIRTFNIDPLAHVQADADPDPVMAPNGARFGRSPGILPQMLEQFFVSRDEARRSGDAIASYAYKIIMNSFYGVLAADACRFAADALAGAITGFGQQVLTHTRELFEASGCSVIYGDTDSLFVDSGLDEEVDVGAALEKGRAMCASANEQLAVHVRERYGVESRLELEFEKYYRRFLLPPMRGSDRGRAKGYAGLRVDEQGEEVEIIGMEAVRRDWTDLAHQLQRELLDLLFHDAAAERIEARITDWVRAVRSGERDADLVYRKGLRKPVTAYTRSSPPHVQAARLLDQPAGVIEYVVTRDGPQPAARRTAPIDHDHYVQRQIEPLVRAIAHVRPLDVAAALRGEADLFGAAEVRSQRR